MQGICNKRKNKSKVYTNKKAKKEKGKIEYAKNVDLNYLYTMMILYVINVLLIQMM